MAKYPYEEMNTENLILRDHLAIDRTEMSNENTLLAYIRTSLTILIAGASLLKFFDIFALTVIGWMFIGVGIGVMIFGIYRFKTTEDDMNKIRPY